MYSKILITEDNIIGDKFKSDKVLNLTSVPHNTLKTILNRISTAPTKMKFVPLSNNIIFDENNGGKNNIKGKKTIVTIVVDNDDKKYDVKIKSLQVNMNYQMVTLIKISSNIKKKNPKRKTGKIVRVVNFNHTREVLDTLNATILTSKIVNSASLVTLIKTSGSRCASMSAMIMILNQYSVPYQVEHQKVSYNQTWIDFPTKYDFQFIKQKDTNDNLVQDDTMWNLKQGYVEYQTTLQGIRKIKNTQLQNKKKEKASKSKIFDIMCKICNFFKRIIDKIKAKLNKSNKTKDNDDQIKFKTAGTLLSPIVHILPHVTAIYISTIPKNAQPDIKDANKVIADAQLSKMLAKSGVAGDKTILNRKRSHASNAYYAGMTSYNMMDSMVTANGMAASNYKVKRSMALLLLLLILIIIGIIHSSITSVMAGLMLMIIDFYADILKANRLTYIIAILTSINVSQLLVNVFALMIETNISDSKTAVYRSAVITLVSCLTSLVW